MESELINMIVKLILRGTRQQNEVAEILKVIAEKLAEKVNIQTIDELKEALDRLNVRKWDIFFWKWIKISFRKT